MENCPVISGLADAHKGALKTFGKTSLYVTGAPTAKVGVLSFPDIFGFETGRAKADADSVGVLGYAVVVVDVAAGAYMDPNDKSASMPDWLRAHAYDGEVALRIEDALQYLKTEAQVEHVVAVGYCYGAWLGAKLSARDDIGLLGNIAFHPSWMVENMLHGDGAVEKMVAELKAPQLMVLSGDEPALLREGGKVAATLQARDDHNIGKLSQVKDFPQMKHGFVMRGDVSDEAVKDAVMHAWHLAVKFLQTVAPLG